MWWSFEVLTLHGCHDNVIPWCIWWYWKALSMHHCSLLHMKCLVLWDLLKLLDDTESQEGASCYQLQYSYHFMREGKEVVSVERALDWCEVCRCDRAITCTSIVGFSRNWQLSLWKSIMLKTAGWCWCEEAYQYSRRLGLWVSVRRSIAGELWENWR